MVEILILFCIFCNFFSLLLIPLITGIESEEKVFNTASYDTIQECNIEMLVVFIAVCITAIIIKRMIKLPKETVSTYYFKTKEFRKIIFYLYIFFSIYTLINTNWSFNWENRGAHQFEIEGRHTLLQSSAGVFYIPLLLYITRIKVFGKDTIKYVIGGICIYSLNGIASGGRSNVILALFAFLIYYYYIEKIKKKYFAIIIIVGLGIFTMAANDRFYSENYGFLKSNIFKILQVNGSSWFLPMVKKIIIMGTDLDAWTFAMHFVTIFVPSFIWLRFGQLSYTRSTFVFNTLINTSQSGLGFMMLADFFWCFGYLGYLLYVLCFAYVIYFFRKNIYSSKPYLSLGAINMVYWFCNQRVDFGAFLKPFLYTIIFLWLLEYIRKKSLQAAKTKRQLRGTI